MSERTELEGSPTVTDGGPHRATPAPQRRALGRYEIVGKLGEGGMGIVYRARDPALAREVALKVVSGVETPDRVRRLLREAQAMAQVKHENLVSIYDVVETDEGVCLAMELVEGQTLRDWLDEDRPWREKLAAVTAAGRGLAAAHERGVVHRDFKPENALVDRAGTVKVVDFGLACADPGAGPPRISDLDLTRTGALLGTPAYMAPEQHAGEIADARSDQFALAVTAWEALCGERPFKGATYGELAAAVRGGKIGAASHVASRRVANVVRRALAVAPGERYDSVAGFIAAIDRAARPRRWPYAIATVVVAAVAIAGGYVATHRSTSAPATATVRIAATKGVSFELVVDGKTVATVTDGQTIETPAGQHHVVLAGPGGARCEEPVELEAGKTITLECAVPAASVNMAQETADDGERNAIRSVIRSHINDISHCFEVSGERKGNVTLRFTVSAAGMVSTVAIVEDSFKTSPVAGCIAAQAFAWRFALQQPHGEIVVDYPFAFNSLATRAREDVARVIDAAQPALYDCGTGVDDEGELTLRIHIAADGKVIDAETVQDQLVGTGVANCVRAVVRGLHFGKGEESTIDYPFVFRHRK